MSKPNNLDNITVKLFDSGMDFNRAQAMNYSPNDAKQQIKELFQSILLEYKEKQLGREGIRILNELHERVEKL